MANAYTTSPSMVETAKIQMLKTLKMCKLDRLKCRPRLMRKKTLCQALNIYGVHNALIHYWWRSKSFFKRIWNYIAKMGDYRERMCNAKCTNLIMEIVQVVALATSTSTINTIHLMAETGIYRGQMHN